MYTDLAEIARKLAALRRSAFRRRFRLSVQDRAYIEANGLTTVRSHAVEFIRTRLAPAQPANDGRQTPYRGHPVFVAQHATATCCRKCLAKWHGIPRDTAMTEEQIGYAVDVITAWIEKG